MCKGTELKRKQKTKFRMVDLGEEMLHMRLRYEGRPSTY